MAVEWLWGLWYSGHAFLAVHFWWSFRVHAQRLWTIVAIGLAVAAAAPAHACNVPVFRYALERWKPDVYDVVLFHHGPLVGEVEQLAQRLRGTDDSARLSTNLRLKTVDLQGDLDDTVQAIWKSQPDAAPLWLVVRYPETLMLEDPLWSGPANRENVDRLIASPARRELTDRLLAGQSVVWVVIRGGDAAQDDAVREQLQRTLQQLQETVKLPDAEAQPGGVLQLPNNEGEGLLSKIPLRIEFSILEIERDDPREQALLDTVLQTDAGLQAEPGPIVVPVFGRGRALQAFPGNDLDPTTVRGATEFLCGACSCSVKTQNPGMDLLLTAAWDAALAIEETAEPPAVAVSAPADATEPALVPIPHGAAATPDSPALDSPVPDSPAPGSPAVNASSAQEPTETFTWDTILIGVAVVIGILLVGGWTIFKRSRVPKDFRPSGL